MAYAQIALAVLTWSLNTLMMTVQLPCSLAPVPLHNGHASEPKIELHPCSVCVCVCQNSKLNAVKTGPQREELSMLHVARRALPGDMPLRRPGYLPPWASCKMHSAGNGCVPAVATCLCRGFSVKVLHGHKHPLLQNYILAHIQFTPQIPSNPSKPLASRACKLPSPA